MELCAEPTRIHIPRIPRAILPANLVVKVTVGSEKNDSDLVALKVANPIAMFEGSRANFVCRRGNLVATALEFHFQFLMKIN